MRTYRDWNPLSVDLATACGAAHHFGLPIEQLWISATFDPAFPRYRRDGLGRRVWRLPDIAEYLDGQRN